MFSNTTEILENGEVYPGDYPYLEENQPSSLEAKTVYLLMQKNVPISRATRLQWLLDHLNTTIVTPSQKFVSMKVKVFCMFIYGTVNLLIQQIESEK